MGSGRPIFLIGPTDCDAAIVVNNSQSGSVHDYNEKDKMKDSLLKYYQQYKTGVTDETPKNIEAYSRKQLAGRLAEILNSLTN